MPNDNLLNVYQQLCSSYQEIDSFRAQLLGRLPLATGAGIFLLYVTNGNLPKETKDFLPAIGVFGFVVTLGLFAYEIYGIMKCHALIVGGKQLEYQLGIDGQFAHRPRSVLGQINEPFAAGIIYPAVLAAWAFLAFAFVEPHILSWRIAAFVFFIGLALSVFYNNWLKSHGKLTELLLLNQRILQAEDDGNADTLHPLLADNFTIVDSSGALQTRTEFLSALPANAHRNRSADQVDVRRYGYATVVTCRVTAACDQGGKEAVSRFWITRLFIPGASKSIDSHLSKTRRFILWIIRFIQEHKQEPEHWLCSHWQVVKIPDESSG